MSFKIGLNKTFKTGDRVSTKTGRVGFVIKSCGRIVLVDFGGELIRCSGSRLRHESNAILRFIRRKKKALQKKWNDLSNLV